MATPEAVGATLEGTSSQVDGRGAVVVAARASVSVGGETKRLNWTFPEPVLGAVQSIVHEVVREAYPWVAWNPLAETWLLASGLVERLD